MQLAFKAASASLLETKFVKHLSEYGLSYGTSEEYQMRMKIFNETDNFIQQVNSEQDSYQIGHNEFSTFTDYEMGKRLSKYPLKKNKIVPKSESVEASVKATPIDWRTKGAVSPVYNTGQCANAWLWNSIDEIQSSAYIHHGTLHELSKQQVIDCHTQSTHCDGGASVVDVLAYVKDNGLMTAQDYPYTGQVGTCSFDQQKVKTNVTAFYEIAPDSPKALEDAL